MTRIGSPNRTRGADVSVIIPTCNRRDSLRTTLLALSRQTHPLDDMEVVVVNDGSTDDTASVVGSFTAIHTTCLNQPNQGATAARNHGAEHARGELLIFMDDDVEAHPDSVRVLASLQAASSRALITGTLLSPEGPAQSQAGREPVDQPVREISFVECYTGLLSVWRRDFFELGMFQDPTGGWPNWDDIDFAHRAQKSGFRLLCSAEARGTHHDVFGASLAGSAQRWYRASRSAVRLFQKYPGIESSFPMFSDKLPINWHKDSTRLITRKMLRQFASSQLFLRLLERTEALLVSRKVAPALIRRIQTWVIGGYQYRGFRQGLVDYGGLY